MATTIKNGALVTAGTTTDIEYIFSSPVFSNVILIEVVSSAGGVQFSIGEAIDSSHSLFVTGAKLILTCGSNYNLHAKATNSADTFRVTR
ncbi:MAG: hypothetical protein QOA70_06750 [Nitrososphaeraceae archaeon]|nr:hypothetical protein [Nitrososphaeraceae archaeon]